MAHVLPGAFLMTLRLASRLADNARRTFTGRETEMARLLTMFEESAPPVWFVEGIAGIGKSRLLAEFDLAASGQGAVVVRLDCRTIEPTAEAFLEALARSTGQDAAQVEEAVDSLAALGRWVVLILDSYETYLLLDSWMRQTFLPLLTGNLRVVLGTRHAPGMVWTGAAEWSGLFARLPLGPLSSEDAISMLTSAGIGIEAARGLNRIARGHPLALQLVIANPERVADPSFQSETIPGLIDQLAQTYLADVPDTRRRSLLEAASVVRRMTRPLLEAMLPDEDSVEGFDLLSHLPFIDQRADGLVLNESVQTAIAGWLRTAAPDQYARFRRAVWRHLRSRQEASIDRWRDTADRLFLLENQHIRDGFFPSSDTTWPVEPARATDWPAMLDICQRHEGPEAQETLELLWRHAPGSFKAVRDDRNFTAGYFFSIPADAASPELLQGDPVLRAWVSHLRRHPLPPRQRAVFGCTWLGMDAGERSSPVQAAIWLNAKRMDMELRPQLRRMYVCQRDFSDQDAALSHLGFVELPDAAVAIDGNVYQTRMLDFGPGSVDGWLSALIAAELSINGDELLDQASRSLVIDGRRVGLTRLEFEVMRYLWQRQGQAVSRIDLLADVWGTDYQGGSNVVDAVVRGLRKKLGEQAAMLESVHGVGYRLVVSHQSFVHSAR
jgi:DNA-binding winged helix-turn-helix (wHTH) protein